MIWETSLAVIDKAVKPHRCAVSPLIYTRHLAYASHRLSEGPYCEAIKPEYENSVCQLTW